MIAYVKFVSKGPPVEPGQCTTPWPGSIHVDIPLSGMVDDEYINLMVMTGPAEDIQAWIDANNNKVVVLDEDDFDDLGQEIVPPDTIVEMDNPDNPGETIRMRAGTFSIQNGGLTWTKV